MPFSHSSEELKAIQRFTVPTIANALETFNALPANEGFCSPNMKCMFPELGTMIGYAVTARITSDLPPSEARPALPDAELWRFVASKPGPKVVVVQDMDTPAKGAIWGEFNSNVYRALGCVGTVTEGGVRDLEGVSGLGFHLFATQVLPSHAYAFFMDYGGPVRVGGMIVRTGDLVVGDRHGVIYIPEDVSLGELAKVAEEIERLEQEVFDFCQSPEFNIDDMEKLDRSVAERWPRPMGQDKPAVRSI